MIKLKSLLIETPDEVRNKGKYIASVGNNDVTFIIGVVDKIYLWTNGKGIHDDILDDLQVIKSNPSDEFISNLLKSKNINFEGTPQNLVSFVNHIAYSTPGDAMTHSYVNSTKKYKIYNGRLWPDQNIISFWKQKDEVLSILPFVEHIIKKFGDPKSYRYDFLDTDYEDTMESSLYTYDELRGEDTKKKLSDKEIAQLRAQGHTDPAASNQLNKMGMGKMKSKIPVNLPSRQKTNTSDGIVKN